MSFSDWLQIVLSIISFSAGFGISWYFFRIQQQTDFNKLQEHISEIAKQISLINSSHSSISKGLEQVYSKASEISDGVYILSAVNAATGKIQDATVKISEDMAILKEFSNISKQFDTKTLLEGIRSQLDIINQEVKSLNVKIINDVRQAQSVLITSVQEKFEQQIDHSRQVLIHALEKELTNFVPHNQHDQQVAIDSIVDLFKYTLMSMGEFQRATIERESSLVLQKIEDKVTGSVDAVSEDLKGLKDRLLLPTAKKK